MFSQLLLLLFNIINIIFYIYVFDGFNFCIFLEGWNKSIGFKLFLMRKHFDRDMSAD